jgi:preprotein translocase subunit SecA
MERMILLHVIDTKWKEHLYSMDQVKDGISLRALGQRDPLVEYKKEGFAMFKAMYASINHEVAAMIFRLEAMPQEMRPRSVFSAIPQQAVHQEFQGGIPKAATPQQAAFEETQVPQQSAVAPARTGDKVGRNDACPCGSGKKYKKCCGS